MEVSLILDWRGFIFLNYYYFFKERGKGGLAFYFENKVVFENEDCFFFLRERDRWFLRNS